MTSWLSLWLAFGNVAEPQGADFHIIVFLKIWADYIYTYIYTAIFVRSCWSEWGVVAATHCHSWWRWWANTLWVTLTRVVTTTLSYQYVNFGLAGTVKITVYFKQVLLWSFLCNLIYVISWMNWLRRFSALNWQWLFLVYCDLWWVRQPVNAWVYD